MADVSIKLTAPEDAERFTEMAQLLISSHGGITDAAIAALERKSEELHVHPVDRDEILRSVAASYCGPARTATPESIPQSASRGPRTFEALAAGLTIDEAIQAFLDGCTSRRDTLFAPDTWVAPRLSELRKRLSEPITEEQASVLRGAVLKHHDLDSVVDWLKLSPMTWRQYQAAADQKREEEERLRQAREEAEEREREKLLRIFASEVPVSPLRELTGADVLSVLYGSWVQCEIPTRYTMPIPEMAIDSIKADFADHCVQGLKALLPDDRGIQRLSGVPRQLTEVFERTWLAIPTEERRSVVRRLWLEHLRLNVCKEWDRSPGNPEDDLNVREFALRRQAVGFTCEANSLYWLPAALKNHLNTACETGTISITIDLPAYSSRLSGSTASAPGRAISIRRGDSVVLRYRTASSIHMSIPVWLGASLHRDGQFFFDITQDLQVIMGDGERVWERSLPVARSWPAGLYELEAQVWYGIPSHPELSFPLMQTGVCSVRLD